MAKHEPAKEKPTSDLVQGQNTSMTLDQILALDTVIL
jgi:hypothetical protein